MSVEAYLTSSRAALIAAALGLAAAGLAPAAAQDCGAAACLKTELAPELASQLEAGGVSLEALAEGLSLGYVGPNPIPVRLIAARYDDGRLVRYGVSARAMVSADQAVAIPDAADVLADAFQPATYRVVELGAVAGEAARPVALNAFVGNVPPSNLGGEAGKALMTPEEAAAYTGSIGVIVLEPDDPALRDGAAAGSMGALVQLTLVRP